MAVQVGTGRPAPQGRRPPRARHDALHRPWRTRLPLLPALVFTVLLTQIPFVMNIWYSLTDWTIVPPSPAAVHRARQLPRPRPTTSSSATRRGSPS